MRFFNKLGSHVSVQSEGMQKNEQEQETTNHENGPNCVIVVENWHALSLSTFAN